MSNLVNRGKVLLNYRLGDVARLDETPCACGRVSPRPAELWSVFRGRQGVLRDRLAQLADRRVELRVVTSGLERRRAADQAATDLVHFLDGARVAVSHVEGLAAGPGGTFRHVVPLRVVRAQQADVPYA